MNIKSEGSQNSERLAQLLDNRFSIPGTNIRFGIDPILGLLPGIGDWMGGLASLYFLLQAVLMGGTASVMIRMFLNIIADIIIGSIPLLGELFDIGWKANLRNAKLLDQLEQNPDQLTSESRWLLWSLLILFFCIILALLWVIGWLVTELLTSLL